MPTLSKLRTGPKKKSRGRARKNPSRRRRKRTQRRSTSVDRKLPGWSDLGKDSEPEKASKQATFHFVLIVFVLAASVTLYVGHVQATQQLLENVEDARAQNQHLHMQLDRLHGEYDRRTAPSVIYDRAADLGLEETVTHGPTLYLGAQDE